MVCLTGWRFFVVFEATKIPPIRPIASTLLQLFFKSLSGNDLAQLNEGVLLEKPIPHNGLSLLSIFGLSQYEVFRLINATTNWFNQSLSITPVCLTTMSRFHQ